MNLKKIFKIYKINKHDRSFQPAEKGQVLLIVLVLMLVGILYITSTMVFMGTSFKTNQVYVNNTISLYASEAGIQDGIWNILNQTDTGLQSVLTPATGNPNQYTSYDYNSVGWNYNLIDPQSGATVFNTYPVQINMKNTWVPLIDNNIPTWVPTVADPPTPGHANPPPLTTTNNIKNNVGGTAGTNLFITGEVTTIPFYQITISYTGTGDFPIKSIGCWLPQGFTYNNGSCNLNVGTATTPVYLSGTAEQVLSCAGNQAVVWTLPDPSTFNTLLTNMGQTGVSLSFTFKYTTSLSKNPEALPWMVNKTNPPSFPYAYTWNFDVTLHDMTATAGNTAIEAFIPKSQTRMLGNAISGDYVATGGSNLTDLNGDGLRETYISSSSSIVNIIPSTASVQAAYLYWSGWARGDGGDVIKTSATGSKFYDSSVTMTATNNGTTSPAQTVAVSASNPDDIIWWDGVRSGRNGTITLNAGSTTVNGSGTNFTSNDIQVGDQITLSLTGLAGPYYTVQQVNSDNRLTLTTAPTASGSGAFYVFDGYYWACKTDVTNIVRQYSNNANLGATPKVYGNGDGTYSISNLLSDTKCVQDPGTVCTSAYAGWSLVIIYSDVSTLGHQLYLYDRFQTIANSSASNPVDVPITISGFITPQKIATEPSTADAVKFTVFVGEGDIGLTGDHVGLFSQSAPTVENILWDGVPASSDPNDVAPNYNDAFNSLSINGANSAGGLLNASGIDIDTFHVPWSPVIVQPGDVTATINLRTQGDGLVSIYVIASFRSSVTSGGSVSYLIKRKNSSP
jgi:hypothetical protein